MELTDIDTLMNLCSTYGFQFSKSLGQNFLINPDICPKMAETALGDTQGSVVEIGTGIGTLTVKLAERASKVLTYEVDEKLYPLHKITLGTKDNVTVLHKDIMKSNVREDVAEYFGNGDVCVCANLPYYITTPVLLYLFDCGVNWQNITVMVQKEAAERFTAMPGTKKCGAITYAIRYYGKATKCFDVGKENFMPQPKVDSSVIQIIPNDYLKNKIKNKDIYFKIVKAGFSQRRKSLANSLSSGLGIEKNSAAEMIKSAGLEPQIRMEKLTEDDVIKLAEIYEREFS